MRRRLNRRSTGGPHIFTPATVVDDSPTTFYFDRKAYQPSNFHQNFMGEVTLRDGAGAFAERRDGAAGAERSATTAWSRWRAAPG